jgi:hypothetical protein
VCVVEHAAGALLSNSPHTIGHREPRSRLDPDTAVRPDCLDQSAWAAWLYRADRLEPLIASASGDARLMMGSKERLRLVAQLGPHFTD